MDKGEDRVHGVMVRSQVVTSPRPLWRQRENGGKKKHSGAEVWRAM